MAHKRVLPVAPLLLLIVSFHLVPSLAHSSSSFRSRSLLSRRRRHRGPNPGDGGIEGEVDLKPGKYVYKDPNPKSTAADTRYGTATNLVYNRANYANPAAHGIRPGVNYAHYLPDRDPPTSEPDSPDSYHAGPRIGTKATLSAPGKVIKAKDESYADNVSDKSAEDGDERGGTIWGPGNPTTPLAAMGWSRQQHVDMPSAGTGKKEVMDPYGSSPYPARQWNGKNALFLLLETRARSRHGLKKSSSHRSRSTSMSGTTRSSRQADSPLLPVGADPRPPDPSNPWNWHGGFWQAGFPGGHGTWPGGNGAAGQLRFSRLHRLRGGAGRSSKKLPGAGAADGMGGQGYVGGAGGGVAMAMPRAGGSGGMYSVYPSPGSHPMSPHSPYSPYSFGGYTPMGYPNPHPGVPSSTPPPPPTAAGTEGKK